MSGIEIVLSIVPIIVSAVEAYNKAAQRLLIAPAVAYRSERFGALGHYLYRLGLLDTDGLQELHWNINCWKDEDVLIWKRSHMETCNAIFVAVSVAEDQRSYVSRIADRVLYSPALD